MVVTISNCSESILNPKGRFNTIREFIPIIDESGRPVMYSTSHTADYLVNINGDEVLLRCICCEDEKIKKQIEDSVNMASLIESDYLAQANFLKEELCVFNNLGRMKFIDLIVQDVPKGVTLDHFLLGKISTGDHNALRSISKQLILLSEWLLEMNLSHGRVSTSKLYVGESGNPVLIDYTSMSQRLPIEDIRRIALIIAVAYISTGIPMFYNYFFKHMKNFTHETIAALNELIGEDAPEELKEVLSNIGRGNRTRKALETLVQSLHKLVAIDALPIPSLHSYIEKLYGNKADHKESRRERTAEKSKRYKFLGHLSDMLLRAWDGKTWSYIDRHGDVVIDGDFIYATDFDEGLAVVELMSGYGLINREGEYVLQPHFHDIEWNSLGNIVFATKEGLTGLYNREGTPLTGLIYERVLDVSEGLIAAKRGKYYGFISKEGKTVIPFIYDDALGFRDGVARVVKNGEEYSINPMGEAVGDKLVQKSSVLQK